MLLSSLSRRKRDGVMPFSARNCLLKFERVLNPTSKQMSVIGACSSLIKIWQARLMRNRFTY